MAGRRADTGPHEPLVNGEPAADPRRQHESEHIMFKKKLPADEGPISGQVVKAFEAKDKKADKMEKGKPKEGSKKEEAMDRKEMKGMKK
jgi:hypothetical protein